MVAAALAMARNEKMWRSLRSPCRTRRAMAARSAGGSPLAMPWTMVAESLIGSTACSGVVSLRRYACLIHDHSPCLLSELGKMYPGMIIGSRRDLVNCIDPAPKTVGAEFYLMPASFSRRVQARRRRAGAMPTALAKRIFPSWC